MTEFEEIDGSLVAICDHEWSHWVQNQFSYDYKRCSKCNVYQYLVPKEDMPKPSPLPTRSRFSLFLADWKASRRKDR
jgi:hypothetical protein